ncbi:MAG TPA: MATE family efflux transporter [Bryobacterales bacterium]|nr:MATE family efflux transporter [Bryobacterales bacterium]
MHFLTDLKAELRPMVRLAWPLVLAEMGWVFMGIVDTMMVGRVSAAAIGAVSLGSMLFYTVAIFGTGLMLGLDTLVSRSFGAGDINDCHRSLLNGVYLGLAATPALMGIVWLEGPLLRRLGIHPAVLREAIPFLQALNWSTIPLLLYSAFRRYLQAMNLVKPVLFALISANVVNAVGDWALIYGHWGARAMGAEGSAWATVAARAYMAAVLLGYIFYHDRRCQTGLQTTPLAPDGARMRRLFGLGLPAAMQIALEIGVFAVVTALIGRLNPASLAAHQIAMNVVTFTYMVPLGISAAAAVRVGQALGRRDPRAAGHSGWTAIALGAGFMTLAGIALVAGPRLIVRVFTPDPAVMKLGVTLLAVGAMFQLFDGVQTVSTGALRGAGDTRTPMVTHLIAYWGVGLPVGAFLCFRLGWGVAGLWAGLCLALILIGIVLGTAWRRKVREMAEEAQAAG